MSEMMLDSLEQLAASVGRGEASAGVHVRAAMEQIAGLDDRVMAFRETHGEQAQLRAATIDRMVASDESTLRLAGAPIAVKDNIVTTEGTSTAGSRILEGYRSPFTATAVERLESAGAIVIGPTNCDEFGMGSSTEHCAYKQTRNPWDTQRVPGGSSGGSAAAVAARMCAAALGSDTGGSIRQPASMCGVVGLKPSYGRVSRWGLIAYGSSLEVIGPMTRSVRDAAMMLQAMAGEDRRDSTTAAVGMPDYLNNIDEPIRSLRIGLPRQFVTGANDPQVNSAIEAACEVYRGLGATMVDVDLPLTDYGIATYYIIATAEASSNLARYDGVRYGVRAQQDSGQSLEQFYADNRSAGFGSEVQRRIMLGTYVLSAGYYDAYYKRAMQVRRLIRDELGRAFEQCDVLLGPTAPTPAFRIGEKPNPLAMYAGDVYTVAANLAGLCAVSIPCGLASVDRVKLPIGLQLQCRAFDEATLLRAARMFELATDHHANVPPIGSHAPVP